LVNSEELEELNFDVLFENFDHRIGLAKHLAKTLRNVEIGAAQNRMNSLNRIQTMTQMENEIFEKFAVKLNLRKSLSSSENLLKHQKNLAPLEKDNLQRGIEQMKIVIQMLESEGNPIIFDKLMNDPYTRQSVNKVRSSCYKVVSGISKIAFRKAFEHLNLNKLKPVAFRDRFSELERINKLINRAVNRIREGDFLTKFHFTTRGSHKQFFKLFDETNIRWTSKKSNIEKVRSCHSRKIL
jgi:hypothetical protein